MGQLLLIVVVAVTVAAVVFGVTVLVSGRDAGLSPAEPDGRAVPLPATRPLRESDLAEVRFDLATRGYRMAQVDQAMRRAAYDIGYKDELIGVLEAEVAALREGRTLDADALRRAREAAQAPVAAEADEATGTAQTAQTPAAPAAAGADSDQPGWSGFTRPADEGDGAAAPAGDPEAGPAEVEPVRSASTDESAQSAANQPEDAGSARR